jgi:predicted MFS family arabinose efflux permease
MTTCEVAAIFGWYLGMGIGLLADAAILMLVMLSPPLGPKRASTSDQWRWFRKNIIRSVGTLPFIGVIGAFSAHGFLACNLLELASAVAAVTSVVFFVGMLSASNHIARRSVR